MERKQSKWFTGCVVAIIVIAAIIFLAGYPFRSHDALKFSFVAHTNDAARGSRAVFGVTNESAESLDFVAASLQKKSHDTWINVPYVAKNMSLAGHTAGIFVVDLPNDHDTWRLPVFWCYEKSDPISTLRGKTVANVVINWNNLTQGRALRYNDNIMMGNSYMVLSLEVTN